MHETEQNTQTTPLTIPIVDPFVRIHEVKKITSLSRSTIYRKIKEGTFPKPFKPSQNNRYWLLSQIRAWQQQDMANA